MPNDFDPRMTPAQRFGRELARCREEKGLSQGRLAEYVSCSRSLISHIESGQRNPQLDMAKAFDHLFALPDSEYFLRLARRVHRTPYGPAWYMSWLEEIEPRATTLRSWDPMLIPGLLQTEEYARAIFLGHFSSFETEVEEQVSGRMERQHIFKREDPPEMHVLLDEWVLKRPIGGPAVMHTQLRHLASVARRRRTTVQIVPYDTTCTDGFLSSFIIAELADEPTTVSIDSAGDGETSAEHRLVSRIWDRYDKLRSEAYPARISLEKIEEAAERWTPN